MEEKRRAIHRLKSMYPIRAKTTESYLKSAEAVKEGRPVVWGMYTMNYGDAIMKAMEIDVVYPENFGGMVAAFGGAQKYLDLCDAEDFPSHLCGYSRVTIGYTARMMKELGGQVPPEAPAGGMPKPLFLMSATLGCDVRYKWFQALGRYFDVPVWTFDTPQVGIRELMISDGYDQMVRLGVDHLRQFIPFVERIAGKKLDWAKLEETVDLMIRVNERLEDVNELRKAKPCPMHARDFWSAQTPGMFLMGDLKDSLQCYDSLYNEVKERVDNHECAIEEEKYRLCFAELPPWHSMNFFDRLAERGWNFVIESYAYHPPPRMDYSNITDPLEKITRFSMQRFFGFYRELLSKKLEKAYVYYPYLKWVSEYKCDGAVLHPIISCRSASFHLPSLGNDLTERLKVPAFVVEGDMVDRRLFDMEGALARAQAFEESMDHYREVRKREGFDW